MGYNHKRISREVLQLKQRYYNEENTGSIGEWF